MGKPTPKCVIATLEGHDARKRLIESQKHSALNRLGKRLSALSTQRVFLRSFTRAALETAQRQEKPGKGKRKRQPRCLQANTSPKKISEFRIFVDITRGNEAPRSLANTLPTIELPNRTFSGVDPVSMNERVLKQNMRDKRPVKIREEEVRVHSPGLLGNCLTLSCRDILDYELA